MTGFSLFPSTDFSSLHFPKTSLEHGERKHIKHSYGCCELGSQKRTAKGFLHTHCKVFFFTLNTSLLKPLTMRSWQGKCQIASLMLTFFADRDFLVGK